MMNEELWQELEKMVAKMDAEHYATIVLWLDDMKGIIAQHRSLRAKLDAVGDYAITYGDWLLNNARQAPPTFDEWYTKRQEHI